MKLFYLLSRLGHAMVGNTYNLGNFWWSSAYLAYPLDLPICGQVIQGRAGGTLVSWHVHADQV